MPVSWDRAIIIIFFFYGLAFYSLGLALLVEARRASELGFARSMRLLAGFGLLHGAHEWLDMFERGAALENGVTFPMWFLWGRAAILIASFVALLAFGEHLLFRERANRPFQWRLTLGAIIWYSLSMIIVRITYGLDEWVWLDVACVLARYILGIPGSVLAFWALWSQREIFLERGMGRFVRDLMVAALALGLYGIVGQFFTKASVIFPSSFINEDLFFGIFGFPVQVFRTIVAAIVAVSMIRVLNSLEVENEQRLEAMKQSQREIERRSHEELTRLNRELQTANEETARLLKEVQRRETLRGELLQRITAAQESERQRIARELHDGTGQMLTGIALGLRGTAAQLQKNPALVAERLPELEKMATTAIGELRLLINDLRPPQLDELGLVAALRWMVKRFETPDHPKIEFKVLGEPYPMSSEVETMLFRIAQEGLTNVTKHAHAQHVSITIDYDDGPSLTVRDNGVGYDAQEVLTSNGVRSAWGLVGMQERASLIDAELELDSEPGKGAVLMLRLRRPESPLERE